MERLDADVVAFLPDGHLVLDRLELDQPNLRLALAWFAENGDDESLLRLASALHYFWQVRGGMAEGMVWLERALERAGIFRLECARRGSSPWLDC